MIENITWTEKTGGSQDPDVPDVPIVPEDGFLAGVDKIINLDNTNKLATLSFDYKITSGEKLSVALLPNWENYYGYFDLPVDENAVPGVTSVKLDNGYTRVTFAFADLIKYSGTPSSAITTVFIRGAYTDATGMLENITWTEMTGGSQEPSGPETEPTVPSEPETEPTVPSEPETEPTVPSEPETEPSDPGDSTDPAVTYEIGAGLSIDLEDGKYEAISFEYQVTNNGELSICALSPDWAQYYGYFAFGANGAIENNPGITCEDLGDGYYRVTMVCAELERTNNSYNTNNAPSQIGLLYAGASTATGTIRNVICYVEYNGNLPEEPEQPTEPSVPTEPTVTYEMGAGLSIDLEDAKYEAISFEYKITNGGELAICALSPDWAKYYGYYAFGTAGSIDNYNGITCEVLSDGYIRVTMNMAQLDRVDNTFGAINGPEIIGMLFMSNGNTATGTIRNVMVTAAAEDAPNKVVDGRSIVPGTDYEIYTECDKALTRVTFDYKVTAGTFNIALLPNWENYYGYFAFNENGNVDAYDGVTCKDLGDGYYRVTLDMDALTKYSGNPTPVIELLYIRGNWSDATGEITNICLYWDETKQLKKAATPMAAHALCALVASSAN